MDTQTSARIVFVVCNIVLFCVLHFCLYFPIDEISLSLFSHVRSVFASMFPCFCALYIFFCGLEVLLSHIHSIVAYHHKQNVSFTAV